ncbi:MAG: UDP-N-acetylmuramate dehydrogenase, partial [Candidatus Paceibacterota bacterium]
MVKIREYVDIKGYSTMKIGGQFRYFTVISSIQDLASVCAIAQTDARYKNIPIFVLGEGSNIVFSDGVLDVMALKIEIKGFEIVSEGQDYINIKVGAGEIWDEIVSRTVEMGLSGFESLSAIPGTVGATPVQNVGAYGAEVKDTILEVEVFDIKKGIISKILNKDCKFGYRDSIFKHELKGKYVITAVTYRLNKVTSPEIPFTRSSDEGGRVARPSPKGFLVSLSQALSYPGIKRYFIENNINNPTLKQIRDTIIDIRNSKLPNPKEIPNVGSFFKNPILSKESFLAISRTYGKIPYFDVEKDKTTMQNLVKIPAGWLIENAGLKGKLFGKVSVYDKNALVLVNNGN